MRHFLIGVICIAVLSSLGCERALFPDSMPRTQYERYDRLRGRYVPAERYDRHGEMHPVLRERLAPPET